MDKEWADTLAQRKGETKTYWEEVEALITEGDEAIIQFLKDNSADYQSAGKLQQEAYVAEWKKGLKEIKDAYLELQELMNNTTPSPGPTNGGDGGDGGGSKPGGGKTPSVSKKYKIVGNGIGLGSNFVSEASAKNTVDSSIAYWDKKQKEFANIMYGLRYRTDTKEYKDAEANYKASKANLSNWKNATITAYKKGGMVDFTGPAWVDGSKQNPEAFLSAEDTRMIRRYIDMSAKFEPYIPFASVNQANSSNQSGNVTIEQILIEVDRMDNDVDLEKLANKVGEKFAKAMTSKRGMSIGNLRIK